MTRQGITVIIGISIVLWLGIFWVAEQAWNGLF